MGTDLFDCESKLTVVFERADQVAGVFLWDQAADGCFVGIQALSRHSVNLRDQVLVTSARNSNCRLLFQETDDFAGNHNRFVSIRCFTCLPVGQNAKLKMPHTQRVHNSCGFENVDLCASLCPGGKNSLTTKTQRHKDPPRDSLFRITLSLGPIPVCPFLIPARAPWKNRNRTCPEHGPAGSSLHPPGCGHRAKEGAPQTGVDNIIEVDLRIVMNLKSTRNWDVTMPALIRGSPP